MRSVFEDALDAQKLQIWVRHLICHSFHLAIGLHCDYLDDVPVRMTKKELVIPKSEINATLKCSTKEPFGSVYIRVRDESLGNLNEDAILATKLAMLEKRFRAKELSISMQILQSDLANRTSVPAVNLFVKSKSRNLVKPICVNSTKIFFRRRKFDETGHFFADIVIP